MSPPTPRSKFTPRPPAPPEQRLPKLYNALVDQINDGYLDNAVRTCRKILSLQPTSTSATKTLLFLLLQTDRYAEALDVLDRIPEGLSSKNNSGKRQEGDVPTEKDTELDFEFEKSYSLYRLHRPKEALRLIDPHPGRGRGREVSVGVKPGTHNDEQEEESESEEYEQDEKRKVGHLRGQILYRAGEYERAERVYEALLRTCPVDSPEYPDITENIASTQTHLDFHRTGFKVQLGLSGMDGRGGEEVGREIPALGARREPGGVVPNDAQRASGSGNGAVKKEDEMVVERRRRTRNKLPKGVKSADEPFEEDPDRWLPLPLRRSTQQSQSATGGPASSQKKKNKKGGKEISGLGMQGAVGGDEAKGGGAAGGQKGKKGKKGK